MRNVEAGESSMAPVVVAFAVVAAGLFLIYRANQRVDRTDSVKQPGSLRCVDCGTAWPRTMKSRKPVFNPCPECEGKCDVMTNDTPIPLEEAWSRKKHADFERFYAAREADRAEREWLADDKTPA